MIHSLATTLWSHIAQTEKIIVFLVMISTLIVLHEYGHFSIARRMGVKIQDFALGIGPTILKWTSPRSGTHYRLNLLPIGGYCAMKGESEKNIDDTELQKTTNNQSDSYAAKKPVQRLAIVVAGPLMNFILAFALFMASYSIFGRPAPTTTLGHIVPGLPAAMAGLKENDQITKINNIIVDGPTMVETIHRATNKTLQITYHRGEDTKTAELTPIASPNGIGRIGFIITSKMQPLPLDKGVAESLQMVGSVWTDTMSSLTGLFTTPTKTAAHLQGIIGIASISGQVQDAGWGPYLSFAAIISASLGIFNLLPIPALDGGRALFILLEILRGQPIDPKKEAYVHAGGMIALLVLMLAVSYHDIINLVSGKN